MKGGEAGASADISAAAQPGSSTGIAGRGGDRACRGHCLHLHLGHAQGRQAADGRPEVGQPLRQGQALHAGTGMRATKPLR
jgi:hypothetical protein